MILATLLMLGQVQCGAADSQIPRDLAGWARGGDTLDTGHAVTLTGRSASAETKLTIRRAGMFGIALDQPAWIDVYRGEGRPLRMAYEGGGPRCTSIRKIVRYRLAPGDYRVVVSRMKSDKVKLMLVYGERRGEGRDQRRGGSRFGTGGTRR